MISPTLALTIATIIQQALQLARDSGVEGDVKAELLKLRGQSEAAHGNLEGAITDALKEGKNPS